MGEYADQIQRVVRRRDFAFAERLSFDEAFDSFQQGEDADFIPIFTTSQTPRPIARQMASSNSHGLLFIFPPYGIWDDIGHATGFCSTAV
ncbi:hypothetical protein IC615_24720 [Serratia ureilytica]